MKFLQRDEISKSYLILSDLHLGAGPFVQGKRNVLEEFHADEELIDFIDYYSNGEFKAREVEIIINGDFVDFLAVPYVNYFDDHFWSEQATLEKLEMILTAHRPVFDALARFCEGKNKKLTYVMGNHDAELLFASVRSRLHQVMGGKENFSIILDATYHPHKELLIIHGHTLERPHRFGPETNIITTETDESFFIPPWGSYYVTRVINKFKEERSFLGAFKPFNVMVVHGFIFDTLFTLRFLFTSWYYLFMVRILRHFHSPRRTKWSEFIRDIWDGIQMELGFEAKFSDDAQTILKKYPQVKVLVMGHNHEAEFTEFPDGTTYLNTGTWTRFYHLDFSRLQLSRKLSYAQVDFFNDNRPHPKLGLQCWRGRVGLPYEDFSA